MAQSKGIIDIEEEYARNKNLRREDIEKLRQWVEKHSEYPPTPDLLLFLCLHASYYNIEKAQNVINTYYSLRAKWPEIFKNRDPSVAPLRPNLPVMVHWFLKQSTHENYKILFVKIADSDSSKFEVYEQLKLFTVVTDFWLSMMGNCEGFVIILDMLGCTWGHIPRIGINPIRKLLAYVQDAIPLRLKSVHFVNASSIVDKLLLIAGPFMKKELRSIIHVHTDFETLYKFVPKNCLPKNYDGDDVTIQELHENMISTLTEHASFFYEKGI